MANYLTSISSEDILLKISAKDWKDALWKSSETLLKRGTITDEYVKAMIQSVEENGPYFVITKNIALAHARPEEGVKANGLTFTTLKPSVEFHSNNDPVKLIITLAATDSDAHLDLLSELALVLSDSETTEQLFNVSSKKEFINILTTN